MSKRLSSCSHHPSGSQSHQRGRRHALGTKRRKPHTSPGRSKSPMVTEDMSRLDDIHCPICMESPHNVVLLICTSYDKGCRPYMCDTSYRHSNCLDQFCKLQKSQHKGEVRRPAEGLPSGTSDDSARDGEALAVQSSMDPLQEPALLGDDAPPLFTRYNLSDAVQERISSKGFVKAAGKLQCPLCRGLVLGWRGHNQTREYFNEKLRACSQENCSFTGCYEDLRVHARAEHPRARPMDIDPQRAREWQRMERRQDIGDLLSSIRTALPNATIMGDYVIGGDSDQEARYNESDDSEIEMPGDEGNWLSVLLLFQAFGPMGGTSNGWNSGRPFARRANFLRSGLALPRPSVSLARPPRLQLPGVFADLEEEATTVARRWGDIEAQMDSPDEEAEGSARTDFSLGTARRRRSRQQLRSRGGEGSSAS